MRAQKGRGEETQKLDSKNGTVWARCNNQTMCNDCSRSTNYQIYSNNKCLFLPIKLAAELFCMKKKQMQLTRISCVRRVPRTHTHTYTGARINQSNLRCDLNNQKLVGFARVYVCAIIRTETNIRRIGRTTKYHGLPKSWITFITWKRERSYQNGNM